MTCPNVRFCHTGSRASAPPVTSATSHPGAGRPSARRTTTTTAASAPTDAPVHSAAASHAGSSARGTIKTAANGGYVNVQPAHRVAHPYGGQTVEHRLSAVLVDQEILEVAAECRRDGRGDDQGQDWGGSLEQAGPPHAITS